MKKADQRTPGFLETPNANHSNLGAHLYSRVIALGSGQATVA
jgi:hypothetical protein